jgi:hypothetical protein
MVVRGVRAYPRPERMHGHDALDPLSNSLGFGKLDETLRSDPHLWLKDSEPTLDSLAWRDRVTFCPGNLLVSTLGHYPHLLILHMWRRCIL